MVLASSELHERSAGGACLSFLKKNLDSKNKKKERKDRRRQDNSMSPVPDWSIALLIIAPPS